jgi:3-methyladenine DNA glycosylase AlkC
MRKRLSELKAMAASDDWHTREEAGFTLRDLNETHFDTVFPATASWVVDPDERVRRASCLACMIRPRASTPRMVDEVLRRLELIVLDDSVYVRKCSGPFVIGYLGYTYPDLAIPWIRSLTRSRHRNARTNAAKAYSQALAARHPDAALDVLERLAGDEDARVRAAVAASIRNLVKRREDFIPIAQDRLGATYFHAVGLAQVDQ